MTATKPNAIPIWTFWIGNAVARHFGKRTTRRVVLRLMIALTVVSLQLACAWAAEPPAPAGPVLAAPKRIARPPQPVSVPESPLPETWSRHELPEAPPAAELPGGWSVVDGPVEFDASRRDDSSEVIAQPEPQHWWQWWQWGRPEQDERDPSRQASPPYHYQEVFRPPPLGTLVNAHIHTQIANGEAAMMVLYRYDFIPGTNQPNAAGMERLNKIAAMLPRTPFPVIIEPVAGNPLLSEARQQQVIALLCQLPFPFPPERVVLANAANKGLHGPDSELIYRNLEILTGSGGNLRTRFDIFKSGGRAAAAANPTAGTSTSQ